MTRLSFSVLFDIAMKNAKRWRWRLFTIGALIALAFILHVLYAGSLEATTASGRRQSQALNIPYYDMLVLPEAGYRILTPAEMPLTDSYTLRMRQRSSYANYISTMEETILLDVDHQGIPFQLLGLKPDSPFFRIPEEKLEGRGVLSAEEIVLPKNLALQWQLSLNDYVEISIWQQHARQSGWFHQSFKLVGIYEDDFDLAPALVLNEAALDLYAKGECNALLVFRVKNDTITDQLVLDYLKIAYPRSTIISSRLPEEMGSALLKQILGSGNSILWMISLFVVVGVLTIALMTFLERRKELAALKTVGISNQQTTWMLIIEYSLAEIGGLIVGIAVVIALGSQISWFTELPFSTIVRLCAAAIWNTLVAIVVALLYPVFSARVATVNQLIYARRIPLRIKQIDHIENPTSEQVYREHEENVRIVKVPSPEEDEIAFFKQLGDPVKAGEVVASCESWFGFYIQEWIAPCDGIVIDMQPNGLIAINPSDPEAAFYDYPQHLYRQEAQQRKAVEQGAHDVSSGEWDWMAKQFSHVLIVDKRQAEERERAAQEPKRYQAPKTLTQQQTDRRFWFFMLTAAAALVICYISLDKIAYDKQQSANARKYTFEKVSLDLLQDYVKASGYLSADSRELKSAVEGHIEEILVDSGELVQQGQVLIRLSNPDLLATRDQAQMELAAAQLQYDQLLIQEGSSSSSNTQLQILSLRHELESLQHQQRQLLVVAPGEGIITDIQAGLGDDLSAFATLFGFYDLSKEEAQQFRLQSLQTQNALNAYHREIAKLTVHAPFSGYVEEILAEPGRPLAAGEAILKLYDPLRSDSADGATDEALSLRIAEATLRLEQQRQLMERLEIRAEASGFVSGITHREGDQLKAGERIAHLDAEERLLIRVQVPQNRIMAVALGNAAAIRLNHNNQDLQGTVVEIASIGEMDENRSVSFSVVIAIDNPGKVQSSLAATVEIASSDATVASISGLRGSLEAARTFSLTAPTHAEVVRIVAKNGQWLEEGELIAVLHSPEAELALIQAEAALKALSSETLLADIEGELLELLVEPGQNVQKGDVLARLHNGVVEAAYQQALLDDERQLQRLVANSTIATQRAGRVQELYVEEGEVVQAGQLLVRMGSDDLDYRISLAEMNLNRAEAVNAAAMLNPASGNLAQAGLKLEQARLKLNNSQQAVDQLLITAPMTGIVEIGDSLRVGQHMKARQIAARVCDDEHLQLQLQFDEISVLRLNEGMEAQLHVEAFDNELFTAKVDRITWDGFLDASGSTYPVVFTLAADARLKAGMSAIAYVVLDQVESTIAIPKEAVRIEHVDGRIVEKVDRLIDGTLVETEVTTGMEIIDMVEIARGLRETDTVAILMPEEDQEDWKSFNDRIGEVLRGWGSGILRWLR